MTRNLIDTAKRLWLNNLWTESIRPFCDVIFWGSGTNHLASDYFEAHCEIWQIGARRSSHSSSTEIDCVWLACYVPIAGSFEFSPLMVEARLACSESRRAYLHVVGRLRFNQACPFLFCSLLVSISVFMVLSTLFRSINPPSNSLFSHSVLPVF